MSEKNRDDYDQKIDNELKKKELSENFGGVFEGGGEVSPEVEGEWLNYIEEFEKQFENARYIPVWDYIGKPVYKPLEELTGEEELYCELERLFELMGQHGVYLDTLREVEDRELYRFITHDLFAHEMDDIRIEGMNHNFIYEEFYPNAEVDIEQAIDHFFKGTMGKMKEVVGTGYDMLYVHVDGYKNEKGEVIKKEDVKNSINNFLDGFDLFDIEDYVVKSFQINEGETDAVVRFSICYNGIFTDGVGNQQFSGDGLFKLKPSPYGGWSIYHISMPGLRIE